MVIRMFLDDPMEHKRLIEEKLETIDKTVKRVTDVVSALKNISRDHSRETKNSVLLNDFLKDVISISHNTLHSKGIKFIWDIDPSFLNFNLICYRGQLLEVFINLIANASDAVEEQENGEISLIFEHSDEHYFFLISDNGPGVPDELREKIFSTLFSTKDFGMGTGLGLSISKNIMKRHQGDLYLKDGSKSTFVIKLPK